MIKINTICWRRWVLVCLVCVCGMDRFAIGVCGRELERPNVLLIVTDDQRPDTINALGNSTIKTPTLDQLVRQGTAFTRAVAPNPICTPSRAEIMTGASGMRNGVLGFGGKIKPEMAMLATTFADAGYRTGYVGKWHNDGRPSSRGYQRCEGLFSGGGGRFKLDYPKDYRDHPVTGYRGWVFQTDDRKLFPEEGVGLTPDISSKFADATIRFLKDKSPRPFFLHVNFTAPHDPLLLPPGKTHRYRWQKVRLPANFAPEHPFDHGNLRGRDETLLPWPRTMNGVRKDIAAYYAVVSYMDEQIGRILRELEKLGEADRTIVVFTSDHGLALGSHGLRGKQNMYEHTIGAPLIMCGPEIPVGETRNAQCYLRDIFPTLCELCQIEIPRSVDGRSLLPVLHSDVHSIYPSVFAHYSDKQRMIRTDRWKLIYYPHIDRWQLFDLRNDPYELHDLVNSSEHAATLSDLKQKLRAWQESVHDPLIYPQSQ